MVVPCVVPCVVGTSVVVSLEEGISVEGDVPIDVSGVVSASLVLFALTWSTNEPTLLSLRTE